MTPEQATELLDLLNAMSLQQIQLTQSVCWVLGALAVLLFSSIIRPFSK